MIGMLNGMQGQAMPGAQQGQFPGQPGQPGQQPGQPGSYPGQAGPYQGQPGQPGPYQGQPGQPGPYQGQPEQPGPYQGQQEPPGPYQGQPGQPGPYQGQQEPPGPYQGQPGQPGPYQGQPQPPYQGQQPPNQGQQPPQQGQGYTYAGGYSESGPGGNAYGNRPTFGGGDFSGNIGQDITNAVLGSATGFLGRAIGRKMQKAFQERVVPAMQARAAQQQQQSQQAMGDMAAIAQRYPDLRACTRDQVVFLDGGSGVVPISEIRMPVTMQQADAIVGRLRAQ